MSLAPRITSLDGLRALSISAVMLGHLSGTAGFPDFESRIDYANLGVRVFFVISGLLITSLLLAEKSREGSISLRQFYFRRTIRIFPAYFAFVFAVYCLILIGRSSATILDITHAATYTTNYHATRNWDLGHAWSLSVEEQFYLIWPAIVAFSGHRKSLLACIVWLAAVPCIRVLMMGLPDGSTILQKNVGFSFETVSDAIATGCLFALLRERLDSSRRYAALLGSKLFVLVPLTGLIAVSLDRWNGIVSQRTDFFLTAAHALVGISLLNISVALCIDWCIKREKTWMGRLLNNSVMTSIGVLSYSLYLWQQVFLNRNSSEWYTAFPQNLMLSLLCALLCYYLIEKPFLRLRHSATSGAYNKPATQMKA